MSVSGAFPDDLVEDASQSIQTPTGERREQPSAIERFISNFLREQNIRWMLIVGATIVFASSLMLVSREFAHWPVSLKYLTVLTYTAMIFGTGEIGRAKLGLKTTSTVLQVLTLFLLPVCFLALNWATSSGIVGSTMAVAEAIAFGVPAAAFLWFAATRIFDHLLRGRQTTFVIAYSVLSMAGAMPRISHPLLAFAVSLVLWVVMTAGMIKINRHIFWMSEEHRWPRIFAFFPSLLLGALFLLLMAARTGSSMSLEWIGFGCVLVSSTILMTARTIAGVFRQRTGDLVRPLPWSIVLPLFVGLGWMAAGVGLAFSGFPNTLALVPSCALATAMLIVAARETGHQGFVWAALLAATMTYQFTPTLFREAAIAFRDAAAAGLHAQKLPVAFYGLTYVPLMLGVAAMYRWASARKQQALAEPLKTFVCAMAVVLQVAAMTNAQAMFAVSAANVIIFVALGTILRDRRVAAISIISMLLATATYVPFLESVRFAFLDEVWIPVSLAMLGAFLAVVPVVDRALRLIPIRGDAEFSDESILNRIGELTGLSLSLGMSVYWLVTVVHAKIGLHQLPTSILLCVLPIATFVVHTLRNRTLSSGFLVWLLALVGTVVQARELGVSFHDIHSGVMLVLGVASIVGTLLLRSRRATDAECGPITLMQRHLSSTIRNTSLTNAFLIPLNSISIGVLTILTILWHLPSMAYHIAMNAPINSPIATTFAVAWLLASTFVLKSRIAGAMSAVAIPMLSATLAIVAFGTGGLPRNCLFVIWAIASSVCYVGFSMAKQPATELASTVSRIWMLGTLAISTLSIDLEYRIVPVIVLPVLFLMNRTRLSALDRTGFAILANVHALLLVCGLAGLEGLVVHVFDRGARPDVMRILFPSIVASVIVCATLTKRFDEELLNIWTIILRIAGGVAILASLGPMPSPIVAMLMVAGFVGAAVFEMWNAVRAQRESYVWLSLALLATGAIWLMLEGIIRPGMGLSQLVMLVIGVVALTAAEKTREMERCGILSRPLRSIGMLMPAFVTCVALLRTVLPGHVEVRGLQALAVFGCAAVYFHQWMLTRRRAFLLLAGAVLNLASFLLWKSLNISDPQFYLVPIGLSVLGLVELMKKELPASSHDPIRYIGALIILVSPVFDILSGSWFHLMSLLVLSVLVVLLSIGLRLKALMYTGTAFILADLVGMVVKSTVDRPALLWIGGLVLGATVIAIAAICENHRDRVLARIRQLSAALATWE